MSGNVVIVGGGISGLAAAYYLGRNDLPYTLIEKSGRLGGLVQTDLIDGCRLEAGPDSFIAAKPEVTQLAEEIGSLSEDIIESNDRARRVFIMRDGRLIAMPSGMSMMVPTRWGPVLRSDLLSSGAKIRLLLETFSRPRHRKADFTVAEFILDHFGREVLDYITDPLLSGVYGGSAGELSAPSVLPRFVNYEQRYGSLIRGARAGARATRMSGGLFRSFRLGMQQLTDALAAGIPAHSRLMNAEVTRIAKAQPGWRVDTAGKSLQASHVVLACPAHVSATLLEPELPDLAGALQAIPYSSAILVTLVFKRESVSHPLNGFGYLVPAKERRAVAATTVAATTVAATTWINTKFPSRIPPDSAAIRAFIVGAQAEQLMGQCEESLSNLAQAELRPLLGISGACCFSTVHKWPASMPQYVLGHAQTMQSIRSHLAQTDGLHLIGNAYDGVGIPDCIRVARETIALITTT